MLTKEDIQQIAQAVKAGKTAQNMATVTVLIADANTEYSHILPAGCKRAKIQCRTSTGIRMSTFKDRVATSTLSDHFNIKSKMVLSMEDLDLQKELILYFACSNGSKIVEIVQWT